MDEKIKRVVFVITFTLTLLLSVFAGMFVNKGQSILSNLPFFHKTLKIKASIPYWEQQNATVSFKKNVGSFDYIQVFWYFLSSDGDIKTYKYAKEDLELISFAHINNVKVLAILTNLPENEGTSWDSSRVKNVLKTAESRKNHIEDIKQKLINLNLDGIIIDYESVDVSQKNKFSAFIKELAEVLREQDKIVAVSVHPKTSDNEGLGKFQDWKVLSESADHISIMSYGEHWDESAPGPIASITWLKKIINYAKSLKIPDEKIYMGIPLYGLKWELDNDKEAQGLTYQNVEDLIKEDGLEKKWDEQSSSQYLKYQTDIGDYEVWFESASSVNEKLELAQDAGFKGVSFWRLGGEDQGVWETVKRYRKN